MKKKETLRNKKFKTVKTKLEYIQKNCNEPVLFDDLAFLFKKKGFKNVRVNHGTNEFGKDLVFSKYDKVFEEEKWYAVIVKNKPARQNDFITGNEIANQILQAINQPYTNTKGDKKIISGLFIVINGNVTPNATEMISKFVSPIILPNIKIYDYQGLKEQIEKHSKESFLDNIEPSLNLFITSQIKKLSDISNTNNVFDLKTNDIESIFVNVQTTYSRELKKINNYITYDSTDESFAEEDVEGSSEIINSNENFIIHGIPTSGKTLFLKRIGIKALRENKIKPNAVFYFDLQNHNSLKFEIISLISNQYKELTKDDDFDINDHSKIILLIDSIDFINDVKIKENIYTSIGKFLLKDESNKFQIVIATRDLDFVKKQKGLEDFKDTELLPFNFGQALELVKKIIPNDTKKSNNFIKALKSSLLNTTLQRTPLALTLLAILYRDDKVDLKELPANIFALYDRFTDVYLDKWDSSKGITQLYKYDQIKIVLSFIAFNLHENGLNSIQEDDLKIFLIELRKQYNYTVLNNIENFINHLKNQNGVFNYNTISNSFHFFNHYFQEYFSSLCIEEDESSVLIENFYDSWWSNSIVFYCGKKPKSNVIHKDIISKIIPIDSKQKIYYINQHSKCLQASHSISIKNRSNIINKMLLEFDSFFKMLLKEGEENSNSIINRIPFVSILNQSRSIFESTFASKHISTEETINIFEKILLENNGLTKITNYNIAYFLSFLQRTAIHFEIFEEKVKDDVVWNRILYVDINLLKLKKKIDKKKFTRIKRKMNKNKFLIQHILKNSLLDKVKKIE